MTITKCDMCSEEGSEVYIAGLPDKTILCKKHLDEQVKAITGFDSFESVPEAD